MTKTYELMIVFKPDFEAKDDTKAREFITKMLGTFAKIDEVTMLGKKTLAYPIRKFTEGVYVLVKLTGLIRVDYIEKQVKLQEDVLRYLLLGK